MCLAKPETALEHRRQSEGPAEVGDLAGVGAVVERDALDAGDARVTAARVRKTSHHSVAA